MIIRTSVVGLALILLAGCGGSTETEQKAPAPPKVYSAAQLKAALPSVKDVPRGKELTSECPGGEGCFKPKDGISFSRSISLELPFTGAEAERAAKTGIADSVSLSVTQNTTAVAATTDYATERKKQTAFDGPFEVKAEKAEQGYIFGLTGSGVLGDATVEGWPGYSIQRDIMLTNLEGGDEGAVRDSQVSVRRGAVKLTVHVTSGQGERSLEECKTIVLQLAKDYLTRLG